MALNAAVAKVRVTDYSGQVETLRPRKARGPGAGLGHIADFRYLAFAVRGPWCAEKVVTYGRAGAVLFEQERPIKKSERARLAQRCMG